MSEQQSIIEQAWEDRAGLKPGSAPAKVGDAVNRVLADLDSGRIRVAEKSGDAWTVHQWIKKAVLLSFRLEDNVAMAGAATQYYDKVPGKFTDYSREDFDRGGFRVVPPAMVRRGAYIGKNVVLMPSFVNIGAYVDEGTMVDTWATVGSCAQIGKNVHLSGGVGIGGVLEPLQANPTIIEDNCFIGARSEIVEGVVVEVEARLSGPARVAPQDVAGRIDHEHAVVPAVGDQEVAWERAAESARQPGVAARRIRPTHRAAGR